MVAVHGVAVAVEEEVALQGDVHVAPGEGEGSAGLEVVIVDAEDRDAALVLERRRFQRVKELEPPLDAAVLDDERVLVDPRCLAVAGSKLVGRTTP